MGVGRFEESSLGNYGILEPSWGQEKMNTPLGYPINTTFGAMLLHHAFQQGSCWGLSTQAWQTFFIIQRILMSLVQELLDVTLPAIWQVMSLFPMCAERIVLENVSAFVPQVTRPLHKWFHRKELDILGRLLQISEGERLRFCQQLISISDSFVAKITSVIQFCSIPTFILPLVKGMFH